MQEVGSSVPMVDVVLCNHGPSTHTRHYCSPSWCVHVHVLWSVILLFRVDDVTMAQKRTLEV